MKTIAMLISVGATLLACALAMDARGLRVDAGERVENETDDLCLSGGAAATDTTDIRIDLNGTYRLIQFPASSTVHRTTPRRRTQPRLVGGMMVWW